MTKSRESPEARWVASQLGPLGYEQWTVALEEAIDCLQHTVVDGALSKAALAWILHTRSHEQRFEEDPLVTREHVLARLKRVSTQMKIACPSHCSWGGSLSDLLS